MENNHFREINTGRPHVERVDIAGKDSTTVGSFFSFSLLFFLGFVSLNIMTTSNILGI